jgi:hypothetical protein
MDALKEIAHALNATADGADRKLRDINSRYLREDAFTKKKKEKSGAEKQFHTKWFGHFLMVVLMCAIPLSI